MPRPACWSLHPQPGAAEQLYKTRAVSQKEVDQAISDQQTAEGNCGRRATPCASLARPTPRSTASSPSAAPIDPGRAEPDQRPGHGAQCRARPVRAAGNAPAPFTIADIDTMWMLAKVVEADSPAFRVGQEVRVTSCAFPGRVFDGKITTIGSSVDANTHRVMVRSVISDPQHELRAGMFATFVIRLGRPVRSPGVPADAVVREGDGTMTVWITADRRRFTRRTVKVGAQHDGYRQIVEGVQPGELIATEGALFLSNALATASQ